MMNANYFSTTNHQSVTDTSQNFQAAPSPADKRFAYLVVSTVPVHLHRTEGNAVSAVAATTDDMLVPANVPVKIKIMSGDFVSWIADSDSGDIFFTATDT